MKKITFGIMTQEKIRERMLAIAKGEYKPKPSEPKIWFTSMKSLAEVLSDDNRALLKTIRDLIRRLNPSAVWPLSLVANPETFRAL